MNIFRKSFNLDQVVATGAVSSTLRRILPLATLGAALTLSSQASANSYFLPPNGVLFAGQRLVDQNCSFHLEMQSDANLVLYDRIGTSPSQAIWSSNTYENEAAQGEAYLWNQPDGNVVLYSDVQPVGNLEAIFATGTNTYLNPTTSAQNLFWLQTNGDLFVVPDLETNGVYPPAKWTSKSTVIPPVAEVPCGMQSSYTQITFNEEVSGTTILAASAYLGTWDQCGKLCMQTSGCTSWDLGPEDAEGHKGVCEVYGGPLTFRAVPGSVAGVIVVPPAPPKL